MQQIADADTAKPKNQSGKGATASSSTTTKAPKKRKTKKQAKSLTDDGSDGKTTVPDDAKMPALPVPDLLTPDRIGDSRKRRVEGAEEPLPKRGRSIPIEDGSTSFVPSPFPTTSNDMAAGLLLQLASPLGRKGSNGDPKDGGGNQTAFV